MNGIPPAVVSRQLPPGYGVEKGKHGIELWHRDLAVPLIKLDAPARTVVGYAATWGKDRVWDRIKPGAFTESIKLKFTDALANGGNPEVRVLWQHWEPLGVCRDIKEDDYGLWTKSWICPTRTGDDAMQLLLAGAVDRMSIGFNVQETEEGDNPQESVRIITKADLWEYSYVTFPANMGAKVESVKAVADPAKGPSYFVMDGPRYTKCKYIDEYTPAEVAPAAKGAPMDVKAGAKISKARRDKLTGVAGALRSAADEIDALLKEVEPPSGDDDGETDDEKARSSGVDAGDTGEGGSDDARRRKNPENDGGSSSGKGSAGSGGESKDDTLALQLKSIREKLETLNGSAG